MGWSLWRLMAHMRRSTAAERGRDRLFNLSLDPLCVLSLNGTIVRANPAFERVLGTSPEALQGTALLGLVHPDDVAVALAQVERLARGEPSTGFENRCRCAGGTYRWLAWSANPAIEEQRLYCVAHDVTEALVPVSTSTAPWSEEGKGKRQAPSPLPVGLRARVEAGSIGEIDVWFDRAIDASSLGGVFGSSH